MALSVCRSLYAETILTGAVSNNHGEPLDYASVIASPCDAPKTILASAFTDETGHFRMSVKSDCDSLILKVSSLEIEPTQIVVPNRSGNYDIIVDPRTVELKEVVVKSKKIYSQGDTINYNVASFLSSSDQSVADVLRKMPGITVSDAGQISYQGKPIKNFYIEGLDLMKGHYGIATNNIDPNNIATVQVLENHQDIKALKGLRPEEQASINLRLKEGVKGVFNLIATLGGGYGDEGCGTTRQSPHISDATVNSSPPTRATTQAKICRRNFILSTMIFLVQAISLQSPCRRLQALTNASIISTTPTTPRSTMFIV